MRIIFVCSCLESGRDGVGDYTRALAGAMLLLGSAVSLLALNDRVIEEVSQSQDGAISCLRLPASMDWSCRSKVAIEFIENFKPDVISVQLVPYAWQKKGIPVGLSRKLKEICRGYPVHLNFHELVIGLGKGSTLKHRCIGWFQKRIYIASLIKLKEVCSVSTTTIPHVRIMSMMGISAKYIPIFGNIPLASANELQLHAWWVSKFLAPRNEVLVVGLFGSVVGDALPARMLSELKALADSQGRQLVIAAAGGLGSGEAYIDKLSSIYASIEFVKLGRLSEEGVSLFLQSLDYGVATTPWLYLGKSGSAMAMLEHGVPLIVTRDDMHIEYVQDNGFETMRGEQLFKWGDPNFSGWLQTASPRAPRTEVAFVAERYYSLLKSSIGLE